MGAVERSVAALVASYVPGHVAPRVWTVIGESVRDTAAHGAASVPAARTALSTLAGFGAWLHAEGLAVDGAALTNPELIERYVQTGLRDVSSGSRATRRWRLRRIAAQVGEDWPPSPAPLAYRRARAPYTPSEVARFLAAAAAQPTAARRAHVRAILVLGLGCGLDTRDLAWVRGSDVEARDVVRVAVVGGPRPRTVVALHDYAAQIADCAAGLGNGLLIGGRRLGRHNVTTPALHRMISDPSLPRLVPSRLRSTWLVRHLNARTPLTVLLPAAGLTTSRVLEDLLEYADPIDEQDAAQLMVGRRG